MRTLRIVWEFRGPGAQKTAEHHKVHLLDYLEREKVTVEECEVENHSEMFSSAYIICDEETAMKLRDPLKPQAAYLEKE